MADDRRPAHRSAHRSAFGASSAGASPPLDPPLTPAGESGGLAPWRRPSGSWRYRPAWFQPGGQTGTGAASQAPAATGSTAPASTRARSLPRRVVVAVGACALAVAVLVAGTLLLARVGGPERGPKTVATSPAVLPAGTVVLSAASYSTMLPAGWRELPAVGLGTRKPGPDERVAFGRASSGIEPMVMIAPASGLRGPIQELAAEELRAQTTGQRGQDVDGPRLRTVAGAQAAVLDIDGGTGTPSVARRVVLIVHGQRVLRLSLLADHQNAVAARQAVDAMLAAWRWTR